MHECLLCGNWFDLIVYGSTCPYCKCRHSYLEKKTLILIDPPTVEAEEVEVETEGGFQDRPYFRETF